MDVEANSTFIFTRDRSGFGDCYGTVISIQYCYKSGSAQGTDDPLIQFLLLTKNGSEFMVNSNDTITVSTRMQQNNCETSSMGNATPDRIGIICCDKNLKARELGDAFAIRPGNGTLLLQMFNSSVDHYRVRNWDTDERIRVNTTTDGSNNPILLFRLLISK